MRKRQLLSGLALTLLVLLGTSGVAHAESDEELREECIEILEDGGLPEDCHEAPSPILPATNELIWGAISFTVLFGLLAKFGFPAIKKGLAERTARIQADVDAAESAKAEAEAKAKELEAEVAKNRSAANDELERARQDAEAYRQEKRTEADAEIARMKEQAAADVESSKAQAIADIRGEVATLAIGAAETVVGQNLDREANQALVEQFIDSVGARGN